MARIRHGRKAPNLTLPLFNGDSVELASYWGNGRSLLLIFLRHLA
jgi:peroxiredoxin